MSTASSGRSLDVRIVLASRAILGAAAAAGFLAAELVLNLPMMPVITRTPPACAAAP